MAISDIIGLLGLEDIDSPQAQGLLGLGTAMLNASGPSTTPVSFGQALGQGLQGYTQGRGQAMDRQLKNRLTDAQIENYKTKKMSPGTDMQDESAIKRYLFRKGLPINDQQIFDQMMRAQQTMNLGGQQVVLDPSGGIRQSYNVTPKPEQMPEFQGRQDMARTTAAKTAEGNIVQYDTAVKSIDSITKIDELINQLNSSDAITGMGADLLKNVERAKVLIAGNKKSGKRVTDTEILDTMLGADVFPMIGALGMGSKGMDTPAERDFLRNVMTGTIPMNKQTLLKMAETRRNISQRSVDRWNDRVNRGELDDFFSYSGRRKETIGMPQLPEGKPQSSGIRKFNPQTGKIE